MNRYAGGVALYNPKSDVLKNINTYIDIMETLYVVDNTEEIKPLLKKQVLMNKKICYITLKENIGLAKALRYSGKTDLSSKKLCF